MRKIKTAERRKYKRIINKTVGVNIIQHGSKKTLPKFNEEVGLNLSENGILIECSKGLAAGTNLRLIIMFLIDSKYNIIQTPAKIAWTKKTRRKTYLFGCRFMRLSQKQKSILKRICNMEKK